jgi:peptidoglycan/LPS O-acetylase OafA/YrhL
MLHFHIAYNLAEGPVATLFSARFVEALARNGNYGVTIFFVISGYLITSTSLRRFGALENVSARRFYAFRFARIIPCLVLVLFIITTLGLAGVRYFASNGDKHVSFLLADFSVLTFWHNVLMAKFGYFNYGLNVLWSLSVEEVFYLTFPLLCLTLRKTRLIVIVWIAAIVFGPIYRSHHVDDEILFLYGYFACFDAIAWGCCMAVLANFVGRSSSEESSSRGKLAIRFSATARNIVQGCAAIFMAWIYLRQGIDDAAVWGPTLMAAGAALFVLVEGIYSPAAKDCDEKQRRGYRRILAKWELVGWLGQRSYELYLFHVVVLAGMRNFIAGRQNISAQRKPWWFLLFLLLAVVVAATIARFYSEPLNRRIRRMLA